MAKISQPHLMTFLSSGPPETDKNYNTPYWAIILGGGKIAEMISPKLQGILGGRLASGACPFQVRTTAGISSAEADAQARKHGAASARSIPGTHKGCSSSCRIRPHPVLGRHADK